MIRSATFTVPIAKADQVLGLVTAEVQYFRGFVVSPDMIMVGIELRGDRDNSGLLERLGGWEKTGIIKGLVTVCTPLM